MKRNDIIRVKYFIKSKRGRLVKSLFDQRIEIENTEKSTYLMG